MRSSGLLDSASEFCQSLSAVSRICASSSPLREETRFGGRAPRKNDCGIAVAATAPKVRILLLRIVPAEREGIRADGSFAFGDQIGKAIEDCGGGARCLLGENALDGKVEKRIRDKRPLSRRRRSRNFFEQNIDQAHHRLQSAISSAIGQTAGFMAALIAAAQGRGRRKPKPVARAAALLV